MPTKMNIKVVGCLLSTSFQTTKYLLFVCWFSLIKNVIIIKQLFNFRIWRNIGMIWLINILLEVLWTLNGRDVYGK